MKKEKEEIYEIEEEKRYEHKNSRKDPFEKYKKK